jgi:hypothetical protein
LLFEFLPYWGSPPTISEASLASYGVLPCHIYNQQHLKIMHGEAAQFRRRHNIKVRRQISRSRQREIARIRTAEDFIEVRVGLKKISDG